MKHQDYQRGFTLIELLVSMVMALVIMGGVVSIYISSNDSYRRLQGLAEVQSNGRFLMGFLQNEIESAGYMGCQSSSGQLNNDLASTSYPYNFAQSIFGSESTGAGAWTPALDGSLLSPLSGNDSITVRGAVDVGLTLTAAMTSRSDNVTVSNNNTLHSGDILMISDCSGFSDVFQISGVTASGSDSLFAHAASAGAPGNTTASFFKSYGANASVVPVATTGIYLRQNPNGINSLYVVQPSISNSTNSVEMVQGVDGLQILYGVAASAISPSVVRYVTAKEVNNNNWWNLVMSVRIEALVSTANPVKVKDGKIYNLLGVTYGPFNDQRLRRKFSTTITLRNRYLRQ